MYNKVGIDLLEPFTFNVKEKKKDFLGRGIFSGDYFSWTQLHKIELYYKEEPYQFSK